MSESTNVTTAVVVDANANAKTAALGKKDSKTARKDAFKVALETVSFTDTGSYVDVTFSKPLRIYVHTSGNLYFCSLDNSNHIDASVNESLQEKRLQAVKYALRNSVYRAATRDLTEARVTVTTVREKNAKLETENALANAKNAVLMFAMSMPNAALTAVQYATVQLGEPVFFAELAKANAAAGKRLDAFAKKEAAGIATAVEASKK